MSLRKSYITILALQILLALLLIFPSSAAKNFSIWKNPPQKKILSNGLPVMVQKDLSSSLTVVQILIKGGKAAEPRGKEGLAYLTTRLTLEFPHESKIQNLMSQATRISMACREDYSLVNISCLSEHLENALELVSEIMRNPLLSGLRIDRVKKAMAQQRNQEGDDSLNVAYNLFTQAFFRDTGYAGSVFGSEDSLRAIKKGDIEDFYSRFFRAGNMAIFVSTDLDPSNVFQWLEKYFKDFPSGDSPEVEHRSLSPPESKALSREKDSHQTLVSFAFPLPPSSPRHFILANLLDTLLGKGLNSRLWLLRSEKKLAYNVNSKAILMREGGILQAYLETDPEKQEKAVEELKKVLDDLYQKGITPDELEVAKTNFIASLLRDLETKNNRTQTLAAFEALGLGYDLLDRIFPEIEATTLEEINTYLKDVLNPENSLRLTVGPQIKSSSSH